MTTIVLGLGSNIDPEKHMREAAKMLRDSFQDIRFSSVYQSKALMREDQKDFLNAVAECHTDQSTEEIHAILISIEKNLGKSLPYTYGPRTIDLDLLLYGDICMKTKSLTIPHPRMHERRFVIAPLCELLDPKGMHPQLKKIWKDILYETKNQRCEKSTLDLNTT